MQFVKCNTLVGWVVCELVVDSFVKHCPDTISHSVRFMYPPEYGTQTFRDPSLFVYLLGYYEVKVTRSKHASKIKMVCDELRQVYNGKSHI